MARWLYPQLSRLGAREMVQSLRSQPVEELLARSPVEGMDLEDFVYSPVGGNRVKTENLLELRRVVTSIATGCGYPDRGEGLAGLRRFDVEAARALHAKMNLSPNEASRDGVWEFMTCILFPDIVRWRFPGAEAGTTEERFLGGVRNTLQRLWWRAHILEDVEGFERYGILDRLGEDEIVQLMERPGVRASRRLSAALCREFVKATEEHPDLQRMQLMREAQKRVIRYLPFLSFDSLEAESMDALVARIFGETIAGLKDPGSSSRHY